MAGNAATLTGAPARSLARAIPVWAWLVALVVVSIGVRFAFARRITAPWIVVDELIYSELARSFAADGRFAIRGEATWGYGVVYPLLISPAYAVFDSLPRAYDAVRAINSFVVSLAALPAYFLARRVLTRGLALFAAALAVAIPSLLYAGEVMTENVFYPLFLCVALALVLALERPTATRQVALLAVCALAYLTRAQALAFFVAAVVAPFLAGNWRSFKVVYAMLGGAAAAVFAVQLARGESPLGVLGAYAVTGEHVYEPRDVARWLLYHVAELDVYLGVFPFAALVVLFALWRRLPRVLRPFLAATAALSVTLLVEVSAFASLPSVQRIEERNLFYLAPLALTALLVWVENGAPRPPLAAGVAAVLAASLPGVIPYERLVGVPSQSDTLMLLVFWRLHERWFALDELAAVAVVAAAVAAVAFLVVPRRYALILPVVTLLFFAATYRPISARMEYAAEGALAEGTNKPHVDWIDREVPAGSEVAVMWTGNASRFSVWQSEFFNRSVGRVFDVGRPMEGGLPVVRARLDARTGALVGAPATRYVLTDGSAELVGRVLERDARRNMLLYEIDPPLRQAALVEGLHPSDTWSGPLVTYTRYGCDGGSVAVALQSDPALYKQPSRVRALGTRATATVPPDGRAHTLVVPLTPTDGRCVARFRVTPTKVPGPKDPRRLGLHFNSFSYRP